MVSSMLVFPAYAGMSLTFGCRCLGLVGFPRLRGDEPHTPRTRATKSQFSPPTRG